MDTQGTFSTQGWSSDGESVVEVRGPGSTASREIVVYKTRKLVTDDSSVVSFRYLPASVKVDTLRMSSDECVMFSRLLAHAAQIAADLDAEFPPGSEYVRPESK